MAGIKAAAYSRLRVAVHEAGHVKVAQHFGFEAFGAIWSEGDHWDGFAIIPNLHAMSSEQRRMVGLAGAAAEMLWFGFSAPLFFSTGGRLASPGDWELIGRVAVLSDREMISDALGETMQILERVRKPLFVLARGLIAESRRPCSRNRNSTKTVAERRSTRRSLPESRAP